jgi:ankyrin repeat protein
VATVVSLPTNPDLDHLRQQARALQQAVRAGDASAAERVARQHPGGVPADPDEFSLSTAQLVVAREYGFASWPKLKHYVDIATDHGWAATTPEAGSANSADTTSAPDALADEFCRLACLTYSSADSPVRRDRARQLLAGYPDLTAQHIWAAAAGGDEVALTRLLAEDPDLSRRRGGPYRWSPLCYLAYSRLDPGIGLDTVTAMARALLDAGADPNEGYLWNGQPYVFTLLTGVFGEGEQGPRNQPRHPHWVALARMLLDAGANPNDSQVLYNRMFQPGTEHLELLFEYGLGRGDGGRWPALLSDVFGPPSEMLRYDLRWAVDHDMLDRVRVLANHGVDIMSAYEDGPTPVELAQLHGHAGVVEFLRSQGAAPPTLGPAEALVAAVFAADREAVSRLTGEHPDVVAEVRQARPGLIVWAAAKGRTDVLLHLNDLGWDINALGRGDSPTESPWQTALHEAAFEGNIDLARQLLDRGADPTIQDARFNATPLGWAEYAKQQDMVDLLAARTGASRPEGKEETRADSDD